MRSPSHLLTAISFSIALTSSCTSPSTGPEAGRLLLDQAAAAMGGWPALDGVTSQEIHPSGIDWEPLQTSDPIAEPRQINSFDQTFLVDYQLKRMRVTFDANRTYPTTAPVKSVEVIDGDVGMLEGTRERLHPSRLATRLRDYNRLPIRLLYTARNVASRSCAESQCYLRTRPSNRVLRLPD
jgi:hypothetical protein